MLESVTNQTFQEKVRENLDPLVVYFTGSWCQPCQKFGPIVETMQNRLKDKIKIFKADMDEADQIASELNIRSLPSLVFFSDGMVQDVKSGTMTTEEFRMWVQDSLP